jgi:HPt (histidine-containing phosphotransfer) domain-containing protein
LRGLDRRGSTVRWSHDVIDRDALASLFETTGNDPAFLAELIDTYLADSVALLESMRQAVSDARADELRRAAHSLKSNSATFGAHALSELCRDLEYRAKDGVLDGAAERITAIEDAYASVARGLRALAPST